MAVGESRDGDQPAKPSAGPAGPTRHNDNGARAQVDAGVLGLVIFLPVVAVTTGGVAVAAALFDEPGRDAYLGAALLAAVGVVLALGAAYALPVPALAGLALTALVCLAHARAVRRGSVLWLGFIYVSPLAAVVLGVFGVVLGLGAAGAALGTRYARRWFVEAA